MEKVVSLVLDGQRSRSGGSNRYEETWRMTKKNVKQRGRRKGDPGRGTSLYKVGGKQVSVTGT